MGDKTTQKRPPLYSGEVLCLKQLMKLEGGTSFDQAAEGFSRALGSSDRRTLLAQVEFHLLNAIEKLARDWQPETNTFIYQLARHFGSFDALVAFVTSTLERWKSEVLGQVASTRAVEGVQITSLPRVCPRCRGKMMAETDWYGTYSSCISCGYVHEQLSPPAIELLEEDESGRIKQRRRHPSHGNMQL
jgi:ribosomal protein S27AE